MNVSNKLFLVLSIFGIALIGCSNSSKNTTTKSISHNGSEGLTFFPLGDGTYAQCIGNACYLEEVTFASKYNKRPVTRIVRTSIDAYKPFACKRLIVPEGIRYIEECSFDFCKMTFLSLPKSLLEVDTPFDPHEFLALGGDFEDLVEVRYAGTVEELTALNGFNVNWHEYKKLECINCSNGHYVPINPYPDT